MWADKCAYTCTQTSVASGGHFSKCREAAWYQQMPSYQTAANCRSSCRHHQRLDRRQSERRAGAKHSAQTEPQIVFEQNRGEWRKKTNGNNSESIKDNMRNKKTQIILQTITKTLDTSIELLKEDLELQF